MASWRAASATSRFPLNDPVHMRHALALAARGLGRVAPNPAVGCVIVGDSGRVVGRGWTQPGGRPHAETEALKQAGRGARGATLYVTLEPCSHFGRTPPCAEALVKAQVARVVCAMEDPDPRVCGAGLKRLRDAGIEVVTGVLEIEARQLNDGFIRRIRDGRPLITLKLAQSLDGKIALASGASRWITGPEARFFGHLIRAHHDAILVGIGTALADDPMLDCRLDGLEDRSPLRVVLDTEAILPASAKLVQTAHVQPTLLLCAEGVGKRPELLASGVDVAFVSRGPDSKIDLTAAMIELGRRGVTRLLVEGGARIHAAFLLSKLADRIELFTAPIVLGDDALGASAPLAVSDLSKAPQFTCVGVRQLGPDVLESFVHKA